VGFLHWSDGSISGKKSLAQEPINEENQKRRAARLRTSKQGLQETICTFKKGVAAKGFRPAQKTKSRTRNPHTHRGPGGISELEWGLTLGPVETYSPAYENRQNTIHVATGSCFCRGLERDCLRDKSRVLITARHDSICHKPLWVNGFMKQGGEKSSCLFSKKKLKRRRLRIASIIQTLNGFCLPGKT